MHTFCVPRQGKTYLEYLSSMLLLLTKICLVWSPGTRICADAAHDTRQHAVEAYNQTEEARIFSEVSWHSNTRWLVWKFPIQLLLKRWGGGGGMEKEKKNTYLKDSWFKRPIESAVSTVLGPRFPFNVIKPQDLWIQQARTWSVFVFNYCGERALSRCLYL